MNDSSLPDILLVLIRTSIPTFNAAELLVFLARHPENAWGTRAIASALKPTVISLPEIEEYLRLFKTHGLVHEENRHYCCKPDLLESREAVDALVIAFDQRPVTLIRTIYACADKKIQLFADSFKLKKE